MNRVDKDLKEAKSKINTMKDIIADMEASLLMIDSLCKDSIEYAKKNGWQVNSKILRIQEVSVNSLKSKRQARDELMGRLQASVKSEKLEAFK